MKETGVGEAKSKLGKVYVANMRESRAGCIPEIQGNPCLGFIMSFLMRCDRVFLYSQIVLAEVNKSVREVAGKQHTGMSQPAQAQRESLSIFPLSSKCTLPPKVNGEGHAVFWDSFSLISQLTGGS